MQNRRTVVNIKKNTEEGCQIFIFLVAFFVDRLLKFGLGCVIEKIKKGVIDAILVGK